MVALKLVANISKLSFVSVLVFFLHKYPTPSFFLKNCNSSHNTPHILPSHGSNQLELRDSSLFRQDTALLFPRVSINISSALYHLGSSEQTNKMVLFPCLGSSSTFKCHLETRSNLSHRLTSSQCCTRISGKGGTTSLELDEGSPGF